MKAVRGLLFKASADVLTRQNITGYVEFSHDDEALGVTWTARIEYCIEPPDKAQPWQKPTGYGPVAHLGEIIEIDGEWHEGGFVDMLDAGSQAMFIAAIEWLELLLQIDDKLRTRVEELCLADAGYGVML